MTQISSYQFNHPKNYIGYVLALGLADSRDEADRMTEDYVTGGPDMARRGAQNMGLVTHERNGQGHTYSLTERGEWLYNEAPDRFEERTVIEVLEQFDTMRGARKRFVDVFPAFGEIAPDIIQGDPAVARLVTLLDEIHNIKRSFGEYAVKTDELYGSIEEQDREFATKLLIRDNDRVRKNINSHVLTTGELEDGTAIYRSPTTYQLKNLCWHMGVLQSKGTQATDLVPRELEWSLEQDMLDREPAFAGSEAEVHG